MKIASFFTGGGFLDLGFISAGFSVAYSNEFNTDIADIHDYGMRAHFLANGLSGDPLVTDRCSIETLKSDKVISSLSLKAGEPFGVIGGPPCPDFSVGGKNRGRNGDKGKLSASYVGMIVRLKPNFFLMENVKGLVSTKRHREFLDELRLKLQRAGYCTDYTILNSLDFGVPQSRERVFMVGFLRSWDRVKEKLPSRKTDGWFPFDSFKTSSSYVAWPSTSSFGATPKPPEGLPLHLTVEYAFKSNGGVKNLPNQNDYFHPYSDKFQSVPEGDDSKKSFKRLHRYRYSPTVCYGNNEVHLHPWEPRRLSVREALRLQTVPDTYAMPQEKGLSIKFKTVGNGVPCKLAEGVAKAIKRFVDE